MRVFAEHEISGRLVDITNTDDGRRVTDYVKTARRYGLQESEIEEDVGGWEVERDGLVTAFDGLIPWACGAVFRCGSVYLGDEAGIYVNQ